MSSNLTYLVKQTIEKDGVIREGLKRNLISPKALALHIVKSNPGENMSLEAVRTSIRRIGKTSEEDHSQHNIYRYLKDVKINLKSGIVKVAFQKGDASLELINRSFKAMEIYGGDTFRVVKGQKILHILVDEENLTKIEDIFHERILKIEDDVCEITAVLPEKSYNQYGLWATLVNEIAVNKISLVEAFSCGTEINIFVREKDSQKTFNILKDMIERIKLIEKTEKTAS